MVVVLMAHAVALMVMCYQIAHAMAVPTIAHCGVHALTESARVRKDMLAKTAQLFFALMTALVMALAKISAVSVMLVGLVMIAL